MSAASGVDWGEVHESVAAASLAWIAAAFLVAQLPRVTQAVSTLGSVPHPDAVRARVRDAARDRLHERRPAVEPRAARRQHQVLPAPGPVADDRRVRRRDRLLREHGHPGSAARRAPRLLRVVGRARRAAALGRSQAAALGFSARSSSSPSIVLVAVRRVRTAITGARAAVVARRQGHARSPRADRTSSRSSSSEASGPRSSSPSLSAPSPGPSATTSRSQSSS